MLWSLLCLFLLYIVCEIRESLDQVLGSCLREACQICFLTSSPFLRSCGVCFMRAAMVSGYLDGYDKRR